LNAAYLKNGRVVYLETRVGALKPDIYKQTWPDDPAHEMDMRFVDQEGRTFFVVRGGDTFADPSWSQDILAAEKAAPKVDLALRNQDFQTAVEAAKAAKLMLPQSFKDHIFHLQNFALAPLPSQQANVIQSLKTLKGVDPAAAPMTDEDYFWWGWEQGATSITLWSGSCCGGFGMHSATELVGYQSAWFCNHGRCPYDSGMGNYGTTTHYPGGGSISGETNANNLATGGGCNTSYDWDTFSQSGCGFWYCTGSKNTHLCNDDAEYEILEVYYGTYSTPYGDINSFAFPDRSNNGNHRYMCNCNGSGDSGGCNGDWNTPWLY